MKKFAIAALFLLLLAACQSEVSLEEPPEIIYGQDVCEECGMIINEARYAASYVTTTGEVRRFDDIGGMLAHDHKMQEEVHIYWVHDRNSEAWLNAEKATFILSRGLVTPMGWGVAAFAQAADAEAYVADNEGVVTTFAALQEEIKSGALDPAAFSDHDHDHEDEMEHEEADHAENE